MRTQHRLTLILGFVLLTASAVAGQIGTVTQSKPSQSGERHLPVDTKFQQWARDVDRNDDIKRIKVCRAEDVCRMRFKEGETPRTRVKNLVKPMSYMDQSTPISKDFTRQVRQALDNLRDREGLSVRFIGYTDDTPLAGGDAATYGDYVSFSKAMAQRVAIDMRETLTVPNLEIETDGRGASHPVASNDTADGRALNRRIEVEFWYDDPLQALGDEPQICPDNTQEVVTRVYDPPWGKIPTLELANGQPVIPAEFASSLRRALTDIAGKPNVRLRFIGYTKNERLDRRTASVYSDDVGLSAARALRAKEIVMKDPLLSGARSEHEGRGYVQSDDVVNTGFTQGEDSFVRVQVVYDEPLQLDNYEGVEITRLSQEIAPKSPYELNVMHITVDGKPIDDPARSSSDVQRCTDVALDDAGMKFHFDNLESRPRLSVAAFPVSVAVSEVDNHRVASVVRFRMYNNYSGFIKRAEIRVFEQEQSVQDAPIEIIAVNDSDLAEWNPAEETIAGPARELKYLLRAYDAKGNFDETDSRSLWLYHEPLPGKLLTSDGPPPRELLAAYGQNDLTRHQIPLGSGTVKVQGSGIPADYNVWVAGRPVPVDPQGNFAAEQILPDGAHTVEVAVLDVSGNGSLYLRDLEFKSRDLFFFGVADITVSQNQAKGVLAQLQGANPTQPYDSPVDGRVAFYISGKVIEHWRLTASADTREGRMKDLFGNFLDKSPDSLFRRIDPEKHYPAFGDDGVVEDMAPTLGKFYVKLNRGENYGMWGNFKVGYVENELAHVDRGLYGANAHFASGATTSFGERRLTLDGFSAQAGTAGSYEEFRGTGGSIYYLRHQDLLNGSERVRIELRDKDSGIVTGVVNLRYGTDYDIDYLQGRLILTEPLSSTGADNLMVRSSGLSGNEAYVVARYEYTPGFESLDTVAMGGQGHVWFGDHVKLGLTANSNDGDATSKLGAGDLTLRLRPDSWFKVQAGRSEGLVSPTLRSDDGGFGFHGPDDASFTDAAATAYRADVSVSLADIIAGHSGRFTFYKQNVDAGYSAPGQATIKNTGQLGGAFQLPVTSRLSLAGKGDQRVEDQGLETRAVEVDATYKLTEFWSASTGVRNDFRRDRSPIVPLTQEQGERTDGVAQVTYDPHDKWRAYGFAQGTVASTGNREGNGRVGLGGSYRLMKRLRLDGEASSGDLGIGGKIGTTFLYSEGSSLYMNYALENERTDNGLQVRRGNLISGMKRRLSDSSSVYVEERYQDGGSQTGLTHATGVNLVARERWNFGANGEFGALRDQLTFAKTDRKAAGLRIGYGTDRMQLSSAVEFRNDKAEQPDTTRTERTALLFRNSGKVQLGPDWRLLGKLNYSISDSSLGDLYNGGYTEAVVGYAYRPVLFNRFNALAKYTFFNNVPTTDQVGMQNTAAEFIQKSHIVAFDVSFDITPTWSIGNKYAYRMGEMSLDRIKQDFFSSAAQLGAIRADWRFLKGWESMIEVRTLSLPDADQRRRGALTTIYRYIGKNMKVGAGYNFTDFSDDLTDLKFDHKGVFFNFIATH